MSVAVLRGICCSMACPTSYFPLERHLKGEGERNFSKLGNYSDSNSTIRIIITKKMEALLIIKKHHVPLMQKKLTYFEEETKRLSIFDELRSSVARFT